MISGNGIDPPSKVEIEHGDLVAGVMRGDTEPDGAPAYVDVRMVADVRKGSLMASYWHGVPSKCERGGGEGIRARPIRAVA
jgi:hypothetical protein